jgi:hypothetical protein
MEKFMTMLECPTENLALVVMAAIAYGGIM